MNGARLLAAICTVFLCQQASASDALYDLEKRRGDITVLYERTIQNFASLADLDAKAKEELNVVVSTSSRSPSAIEYEAAKAYAEAVKTTFPRARFTIGEEGVTASDYYMIVEASRGHDLHTDQAVVYSSRSTSVRCGSSFGDTVECRESGSRSVPVGTRDVRRTERYVDIEIWLLKPEFHDRENPMRARDGSSIFFSGTVLAQDSFSVAYEAGDCENEAAASGIVASLVAAEPLLDRPRKFRLQSSARALRCDQR